MLKIEHLTKTYGKKKAVDDLSLHICPGEIYGFIGHNGAGKTSARTSPSELRTKQSCLSLATSIPTQIMMKYLRCVYLIDAGSTGHFTLVTLFHINRLAVFN